MVVSLRLLVLDAVERADDMADSDDCDGIRITEVGLWLSLLAFGSFFSLQFLLAVGAVFSTLLAAVAFRFFDGVFIKKGSVEHSFGKKIASIVAFNALFWKVNPYRKIADGLGSCVFFTLVLFLIHKPKVFF